MGGYEQASLDEIDALREGWDFEAKAARGRDGLGALPHEFWPTYSAMANAEVTVQQLVKSPLCPFNATDKVGACK